MPPTGDLSNRFVNHEMPPALITPSYPAKIEMPSGLDVSDEVNSIFSAPTKPDKPAGGVLQEKHHAPVGHENTVDNPEQSRPAWLVSAEENKDAVEVASYAL